MSSGIGEENRDAFEMLVEISGQTIIIHKQFNTANASSLEAKGLKNTQGTNSKQVVFQFLEAININVGDVLQIKAARDFWKVIDTEDVVEDDTFINFDVFVEKINLLGKPTMGHSRSNMGKTVINLNNSPVGFLNTGEIKDVESITANVSTLNESGKAEIAKALKVLTDAVVANSELSSENRAYVLENLEELSHQAALEPKERKSGVVKSILLGVGATLGAAGGLAEVWSTWGQVIRAYFGV